MIYGVTALAAGLTPVEAQAMSCIVFAGSAQFVIAQLVGVGTPALVIVLTVFIINIRHALYSASLAPFVKRLPVRWKLLLSYLLTDEAYAVTMSHYRKTEIEQVGQHEEHSHTHWYFFGAGLALWTTWQISTAAGIVLGAKIPSSWSLDFASTLTFIALVVPALKDRASVSAAFVAGCVAVFATALPLKLGIAVSTLIGIAVGLTLETLLTAHIRRKREEES
jgi:4-azaleucine resistance transporter AzlC